MEIRPIKKSEWEKLRAFNEAEYKPGHILTNKIYYDWQFDGPFNLNKESYESLGLFDSSETLVGTFGLFASPFNFFGQTVSGVSLCNLIVKKSLRSLGYGYLLMEKAAALADLALDHTINETAWPIFMKAGWKGENLKRYLYVINPKNALYDLPASSHKINTEKNWHFDEVTEFSKETDIFWHKIQNRYPIAIERNAVYLNWRYARNPLIKYRMLAVKSGEEIKALAILRIEEPKTESGPLGIKVGRLIDFISDEEAELFAIGGVVDFCRASGLDFIDYFSSGPFHRDSLSAAGFIDGERVGYNEVPLLFNPVSAKRRYLNFAVKIGKSLDNSRTWDLYNWYTTKGGGDQDRAY
ncbi:MAG: hypothetical protein AAB885_01730 [Patescibacteria group bacterium]